MTSRLRNCWFKVCVQFQTQESRQLASSVATRQIPFCRSFASSTLTIFIPILGFCISIPAFIIPAATHAQIGYCCHFYYIFASLLPFNCQCYRLWSLGSHPPPRPCQLLKEKHFHPYKHLNIADNCDLPTIKSFWSINNMCIAFYSLILKGSMHMIKFPWC